MQILAVVVLYKMSPEDSQTILGLRRAFADAAELAAAYNVLLWDNSAEPVVTSPMPAPFSVHHSGHNLGVSGAYNEALRHAQERGNPWMLLLDQDTTVTRAFLEQMLAYARSLEAREAIAAVAPTVRMRGVVISPSRQLFNRNRPYSQDMRGEAPGEATAANSGCLMRVAALAEIGGFNTDFWLDYSDMYVFHQFYLRGKKVWLAPDVELEHELSVMDYDRLMTPWRYRNFSYAETAYNDLYKGRLENLVQSMRLFARAVKQRRKYKNPEFSRIAWEQFLYRARVPRQERISRWRAQGEARRHPADPLRRAVASGTEIGG